MGALVLNRKSTRFLAAIAAAVALTAMLTIAVSASTESASWSGVGKVLFAGPSQDPATPTTTTSEFRLKKDGSVKSVVINTSNELVIGILGDGAGGSGITECRDRGKSNVCEELEVLLKNAQIKSFHNSTATLRNITQSVLPIEDLGLVPTLTGDIRGKLEGVFSIDTGKGGAVGTARLRILKGSTATYACFVPVDGSFIPWTSLDPCVDSEGIGQMFPLVLNVMDKGKFEIGNGTGSMADIVSLAGKVEVNAQANLLLNQFGGDVLIPRARATMVGDEPVEDGDDDDDDDDDEDEDDDGEDEDGD